MSKPKKTGEMQDPSTEKLLGTQWLVASKHKHSTAKNTIQPLLGTKQGMVKTRTHENR